MPDTKKSIPIGVKASNALSAGEWDKVTNLTSRGTHRDQAKSSGETVLNPTNSDLTWDNGDVLSIEINGKYIGSKSVTITKGGVNTTVTTTADAGPTVSL